MASNNLEPQVEDVGVGNSPDDNDGQNEIEEEDLGEEQNLEEDQEIQMDPTGEQNAEAANDDPQPTPLPQEHLQETQPAEAAVAPKVSRMATVVRTAMLVKNWALNRMEDEENVDATDNNQPAIKLSTVDDPFVTKFSVVAAHASANNNLSAEESAAQAQKPSLKQRIKNFVLRPANPSKDSYYYWTVVIAAACLYNLIFIFARSSFDELQENHRKLWFACDYISDFIYILDMVVLMKRGYLEQGLMVLVPKKLALNYMKSWSFAIDVASVFPTDLAYLFMTYHEPLIRSNRILRCRRITDFSDRTETRTNFPNAFRIFKMILVIFVVFHINACIFFEISKWYGKGSDNWVFDYNRIDNPQVNCHTYMDEDRDWAAEFGDQASIMFSKTYGQNETCRLMEYSNVSRQYLLSFYWSALTLAAIGEQPRPERNFQYAFVTVDIILGMLIFATIVGNVGSMISNMNAAEAEFVERLDGVKQFMEYRKCNPQLRKRVVNWFNYIWSQKQSLDEGAVLDQLPTKLKAELAIHVHMATLKRVRIFQDIESGLLVELVLKLKLQVFSPGDYICRKGDIGKEMYIVKRGSLNVVSDDGKIVFVTLKAGSVFGELSILNIPGNKTGNRRSATVRSVGYSDLFVLSKDDLWDALREYPDAKRVLLHKGREILMKDNLIDETVKEEEETASETLDQKMARLARQIETLEENFDGLYEDFASQSSTTKKRLTHLEETYKENRKQIKKDCMRGLL